MKIKLVIDDIKTKTDQENSVHFYRDNDLIIYYENE